MKKTSNSPGRRFRKTAFTTSATLLVILLGACSTVPPTVVASPPIVAPVTVRENSNVTALNYYQTLQRMTPAQISRERAQLAALPPTSANQVRMAMLLGLAHGQQELTKALGLLDGVLKSTELDAVSLHPLARLLAENYGERQKLEAQVEKQEQQLKESRRKAAELQEKIDELADIERTLPQRPRARRPAGGVK